MSEDESEKPPIAGLQLYSYEIGTDEEPGQRWGQLAGGMHRLFDLREALKSATRIRDVERSLHRLVIYIEAFFARVYELRAATDQG